MTELKYKNNILIHKQKDCVMMCIDSSTKKTGCSIFLNGVLWKSILINFEQEENIDNRFALMAKELLHQLNIFCPYIIYIEETVVLRNASTQRFLTRLQGVVYGWSILNDCEYNTVRPTQWRKMLGFKQGKNVKRDDLKTQAVQYVERQYHVAVNDDVAESICIGIYAIKFFNQIFGDVKKGEIVK